MVKRILAIDIGNTAATVGFYEAGRLKSFGSIYYDDIPKYAKKCLKSGKNCHLDAVISSVHPKITRKIKSSISKISGVKTWVVGDNLPIKIRYNYNNYNNLGCDRKVNAYGAAKMYRLPLVVIDYGTAITVDLIDAKEIFQGGMIIPGPETAFRALGERAALLPKLSLPKTVKTFLGQNTRECMEAGILWGYGAMTDGLVSRFKEKYGKNLRVLATGGFSQVIRPYTQSIDIVDPMHSIKSLLALFREFQSNKKSA